MTGHVDPVEDRDVENSALVFPPVGGGGSGFGSFRFWFATQCWEWSPEVYRMHGYSPGEVQPTTELLLSHKHPEDRAQVAELIRAPG
ncbi:PAS domain-containing protein [Nocardia sp. NPDC051321]|uniref:PAS domain-containing protein n=1 Tax=Nocardia sp. NPDC051321 TaxID=3364323 RepID=UPI00378CDA9C